MIVPIYAHPTHTGFFAGIGDGIVTVGGEPNACQVFALNPQTLQIVAVTASLPNGRYWLNNLDPKKPYLLIARDNLRVADSTQKAPPTAVRDYEPYCYDDVYPANHLSWSEQVAMWQNFVDNQ